LCLVAGFMTLLDVSIVNVALPSIEQQLHAESNEIQWIVAGYGLAFGILLVPAGRLGDARSRRTVFTVGLAAFTLSSAACGAAPTATWLVIFRVAQGFAAGVVSPQVSGYIQTLFRGPERARAFGLFGLTVSVSTAIGPLLGGLLLHVGGDAGWRLVFYVNAPVGLVALLLVPKLLPETTPGRRQSLDPVGVLLFAAAVFLVLLPLVEGDQSALSSRPWWLLVPCLLLFVTFGFWERHWKRRGKATLVETRLGRVRSYLLGLGVGTFFFAGFTSIFLVLTLYLQNGLGYSALEAGVTQTSYAIGSAIASPLGGRIVERLGRSLIVIGTVICLVGLIGVDVIVSQVSQVHGWMLAPALFVAGFGTGLTISPNVTLTLSEVDPAYAGSAGGLLQTVQRVGSAVGVALVLAQFFQVVAAEHDVAAAFATGLHTTMLFVVVAMVIAIVDVTAPQRRRSGQSTEPALGD
jgi:EmrB/QacA subfamily drug resistance transporter